MPGRKFKGIKGEMMITKEQAIELAGSKFWEDMTYREIAEFQMCERLLCMPFDVFHEAIEKTLGRPVFTHELGLNHDGILKELFGEKQPLSMEDIIKLNDEKYQNIYGSINR